MKFTDAQLAYLAADIASWQPWKVRCAEIRGRAEALTGQTPPVPRCSAEIIRTHPQSHPQLRPRRHPARQLTHEAIREAAGYEPNVTFTIPRVLSPDKSKALIALLRLDSKSITVAAGLGQDTHSSAAQSDRGAPAVPAARNPSGSRHPDRTREETVSAMDVYSASGATDGAPIPGQGTAAIPELSTAAPTADDFPIENRNTERFMTTPAGTPREAERAEAALVHRYTDYMTAKGIAVGRRRYRTRHLRPMFCDLWVQDRHALIEAKNSDDRERLRMAIGQLYDYRRFHEPPVHLAVLLPHEPRPDGLALLQSAGIEAIWPHGTGFRDSANGTFV